MDIRILSAGQEIGPYSESQVRQYLNEGLVSPSDLATYDGAPDWLALHLLLANLPRSQTSARPENASSTESTRLASIGAGNSSRKRGPIVLQPIFAGGEGASSGGNKKTRSGRTTLTIEPLRPTTQLPPVAKFVPREEKKSTRSAVSTGPLSPGNFFEKPVVEPDSLAPNATPQPVEELIVPDEPQAPTVPDIPPAAIRRPVEESGAAAERDSLREHHHRPAGPGAGAGGRLHLLAPEHAGPSAGPRRPAHRRRPGRPNPRTRLRPSIPTPRPNIPRAVSTGKATTSSIARWPITTRRSISTRATPRRSTGAPWPGRRRPCGTARRPTGRVRCPTTTPS